MKENVIIVIPVYQSKLSNEETASLTQCLQVLNQYPVSLVCPRSLDVSAYESLFREQGAAFRPTVFDDCCFDGIQAYNRLLLSRDFYLAFQDYHYMLIYQLDAYVFKDELDYWCRLDYDYIGAPFNADGRTGLIEDNGRRLVGNGGFSLRKVATFIRLFDISGPVLSSEGIDKINSTSPRWKRLLLILLAKFGYRNTMHYFVNTYKHNEDGFYACLGLQKKFPFRIPDFEEALRFAWEQDAGRLYELNGRELPFGCHAWMKYHYEEFWKRFIRF